MADPDSEAGEITQAIATATRFHAKAIETLAALETEMATGGWKPEYRAIMWEAVARRAMLRSVEARRG